MFEEQQKSAYRNVKAPDELRAAILNECETEQKKHVLPFRINSYRGTSIAACLAFVLLLSYCVAGTRAGAMISVQGALLSEHGFSVTEEASIYAKASSDAKSNITIPMDLKTKKAIVVEAEDGSFVLHKRTDSVLDQSEERIRANGDISFDWVINLAEERDTYFMTLTDGKGNYLITLTYYEDENEWYLTKTEIE